MNFELNQKANRTTTTKTRTNKKIDQMRVKKDSAKGQRSKILISHDIAAVYVYALYSVHNFSIDDTFH